jgi:lipid A 3-O-deacylase
MLKFCSGVLLLALLMAPATHAQGPEEGGNEIEFWTGGGHGTNGSTASDGVWNAGVRYGWVLTKPHGPGFLRGRFEYAVDVVPVFMVFQPANRDYGFALNPVAFKWDFDTGKNWVPYMELGGGLLFSEYALPTGSSKFNFTPTGAIGVHRVGDRFTWTGELRFLHISNAGIVEPNPGINTLEVRVGFGWFTHSLRGDKGKKQKQ